MEKSIEIKVLPSNEVIKSEKPGDSLLVTLRNSGYSIKSKCGGVANCRDCIVKISSGENNINAPTFDETKLLGNVFHITKERLSCQVFPVGSIEVDITNQLSRKKTNPHTTKLRKKKDIKPQKKNWPKKDENKSYERRPRPFRYKNPPDED